MINIPVGNLDLVHDDDDGDHGDVDVIVGVALNNFRLHVYAQKSLLIAENCNGFFGTAAAASPSPVTLDVIELVPS